MVVVVVVVGGGGGVVGIVVVMFLSPVNIITCRVQRCPAQFAKQCLRGTELTHSVSNPVHESRGEPSSSIPCRT